MQQALWVMAVVLLLLSPHRGWAGNNHPLPQGAQEFQAYAADPLGSYVVRGCLHGLSGSTSAAIASCQAYTLAPPPTRYLRYVEDTTSRTVTYSAGDGSYWLALHPDTTTAVAGWSRALGSHYLWQQSAARPVVPGGMLLMLQAVVSGGAITVVEDLRVPASLVREGTYNVTDSLYGGVADDATDLGPALQAAIDAAGAQRGARVRIPQGVYRMHSGVTIREGRGVVLHGDNWVMPAIVLDGRSTQPYRGTWLHISSPSFTPLTIRGSGTTLKDLAFDQDHPAPGPGWAPTDYPFVVEVVTTSNCCDPQIGIGQTFFDNLLLWKINRGVRQYQPHPEIADFASGSVDFNRIFGQVFSEAVRLEWVADVSRISNVHLLCFWSQDTNVLRWQEQFGQAFTLLRADSLQFTNIFLLGTGIGLSMIDNPRGAATAIQINSWSCDGVRICLFSNQNGTTGQWTNIRAFYWNYKLYGGTVPEPALFNTSTGIRLAGTNAKVDVINFEGGFHGSACILVDGGGSTLSVYNVRCTYYNAAETGVSMLQTGAAGGIQVAGRVEAAFGYGGGIFGGNFITPVNPAGLHFDGGAGAFFANSVAPGFPSISFAPGDAFGIDAATHQFRIANTTGAFLTGGVKKYLCVQDGVISVATSCP